MFGLLNDLMINSDLRLWRDDEKNIVRLPKSIKNDGACVAAVSRKLSLVFIWVSFSFHFSNSGPWHLFPALEEVEDASKPFPAKFNQCFCIFPL